MKSIADPKTYHSYIDGLRGIAVLMVLAVHTSQYVGNLSRDNFRFEIIGEYVNEGARGVQLFFLLSAFTLFASSIKRFSFEKSPQRNFYIRRAFRILPFWWLITLVYFFKDDLAFQNTIPSFLMYFGFIRFLPNSEAFPLGWTIFAEGTFYILLPLIFIVITSLRKAIVFLIATLLLASIWVKYAPILGIPETNCFIKQFPLAYWYCFAGGIVVYFIYKTYGIDWINDRTARILEMSTIIFFLLLLRKGHVRATITLAVLFVTCMSSKTFFGKITRIKLLKQFGVCCYSIYLSHILILDFCEPLKTFVFNSLNIHDSSGEIKFLVWFPLIAAICLLFGMVAFVLIEKPCVNLGKKFIVRLGK